MRMNNRCLDDQISLEYCVFLTVHKNLKRCVTFAMNICMAASEKQPSNCCKALVATADVSIVIISCYHIQLETYTETIFDDKHNDVFTAVILEVSQSHQEVFSVRSILETIFTNTHGVVRMYKLMDHLK